MPEDYNQRVISLVQSGFESLSKEIRESQGATAGDLNKLRSQVLEIAHELKPIADVFRGRGDNESLETRIFTVERDVAEIKKKTTITNNRIWSVFISAIIAVISAIISAIIAVIMGTK